ncbi:MAG TPA: hypothetical protein VNJ54_07895 [Plantibacter sp.]|uniref:hypothetical protein n=1 Tax=Plantibacter sp. TaxID=1871045 RepID=UPI002C54C754|nr:hypothetical protein [Plantibacter sp.]
MSKLHALWQRIREPRIIKTMYLTYYVVAVWVGVVTLINPPNSISGEIGGFLTLVWSLFFLIGGAMGVGAVLPGWWWLERLGIFAILTGILIYSGVVLALHFMSEGSRLTQFGVLIFATGTVVPRLPMIWRYSFEPRG